jgi:hypothetical protein
VENKGDAVLQEMTSTIQALVDEGNGTAYDEEEDFDELDELDDDYGDYDYEEDEPSGGLEEPEPEDDDEEYTSGSGEDEDDPTGIDIMRDIGDDFMQSAMDDSMVDDGDGAYGDEDEDEDEEEEEPPTQAPHRPMSAPSSNRYRYHEPRKDRPERRINPYEDMRECSVGADEDEPDIPRMSDEDLNAQNSFVEALKRHDAEYGRRRQAGAVELETEIKDHPVLVEDDEAEREREQLTMLINNIQYAFKSSLEAREVQMKPLPHIRDYKNHADIEKTIFKKPKIEKQGYKDQIIFFTFIAVIFSAYFGLKASTYYCTVKQTSDFLELLLGIMSEQDLGLVFNPFSTATFMKIFLGLAVIFVIVEIFIILELDEKKRARVGKEHGSARLATSKDAREFRNSMME